MYNNSMTMVITYVLISDFELVRVKKLSRFPICSLPSMFFFKFGFIESFVENEMMLLLLAKFGGSVDVFLFLLSVHMMIS